MTSWREQAACRDMPTSMFVSERMSPQREAAAKAVCAGCPVRHECLADCMSAPGSEMPGSSGFYALIGVWGGTTYDERRRAPKRLTHGRDPAYRSGCRCDLCVAGAWQRRLDAKRRQAVFRAKQKAS